jgi:hypothetical protein
VGSTVGRSRLDDLVLRHADPAAVFPHFVMAAHAANFSRAAIRQIATGSLGVRPHQFGIELGMPLLMALPVLTFLCRCRSRNREQDTKKEADKKNHQASQNDVDVRNVATTRKTALPALPWIVVSCAEAEARNLVCGRPEAGQRVSSFKHPLCLGDRLHALGVPALCIERPGVRQQGCESRLRLVLALLHRLRCGLVAKLRSDRLSRGGLLAGATRRGLQLRDLVGATRSMRQVGGCTEDRKCRQK